MDTFGNRKDQKTIQLIREAAAAFVQLESNRASLITITGVRLDGKNSKAEILFTVMPQEKEAAVLEFLQRKQREFLEYTRAHARIGRNYMYSFAIDFGEHHRQHIEELMMPK